MSRKITDPFEVADLAYSNWTSNGNYTASTLESRQWKGFGGSRSIYHTSSGGVNYIASPSLSGGEHNHVYIKTGLFIDHVTSLVEVRAVNGSGTLAFKFGSSALGTWRAYRGSTEIADSGITPATGQWYLVEMEVYSHDTNGIFKVWLDNNLIIDFSGDTLDGTTKMLNLRLHGSYTHYWDDIAVNSITMRYDTETSGPFQVGELITGATNGGTAIITILEDNGTTGVFTLEDWNGIAFDDGEAIEGGTSFADAFVDAPNAAYINGFEPNSGRIGNGFITSIAPNANGTNSQLTGSDGNSVDNYLLVDERVTVASPAEYVDATAADQKDTYKGNISGSLPTTVDSIINVSVATYAQSSLTGIDGVKPVVRISGTDYDGDRTALGAGFQLDVNNIPVNPSVATSSDQTWDLSTITDSGFEFGTKFVA